MPRFSAGSTRSPPAFHPNYLGTYRCPRRPFRVYTHPRDLMTSLMLAVTCTVVSRSVEAHRHGPVCGEATAERRRTTTQTCAREGGGKRKKRKQYPPTPTLASLLFQSPFLGDPHLLHSQPSRVLTRFVTHTIHPVSQSGHAHFLPPGKSPVQPRRRWVSSSRQATCATISNVSAFKGSIATSTLYHHTGLFHGHLLRRLGERQTARVG